MMNRVLRIEKGIAEVVELPMPSVGPGFVLVHQAFAPNCIEHRAYETGFREFHESPLHYGHEGVGTIVEVGPGVPPTIKEGQRVVVFQGWACGSCYVCENGLGATHCINLKVPMEVEAANKSESGGAGFSQYRLVPYNMVSGIPDTLDFKHAAAANCLIGCTYSSIRDLHISGEHVCLLGGVGFIGHATLVNLKYRGAKVIVLGRDERRMTKARELGADLIVNPNEPDWMEQVQDFTHRGQGPDFAFECSGYPYYQQKCLDALRHYGTLVLLGYAAHEGKDLKWELNTEYGVSWGHKTITSHFDVNFNHRTDLIRLLEDPWIQDKVDDLVSDIVPMSEAKGAFEKLIAKQADKVFFVPDA